MKQHPYMKYIVLLLASVLGAAITMLFTGDKSVLAFLGWVLFFFAINYPWTAYKNFSCANWLRRSKQS